MGHHPADEGVGMNWFTDLRNPFRMTRGYWYGFVIGALLALALNQLDFYGPLGAFSVSFGLSYFGGSVGRKFITW